VYFTADGKKIEPAEMLSFDFAVFGLVLRFEFGFRISESRVWRCLYQARKSDKQGFAAANASTT
jgi:hypothetical protein